MKTIEILESLEEIEDYVIYRLSGRRNRLYIMNKMLKGISRLQ